MRLIEQIKNNLPSFVRLNKWSLYYELFAGRFIKAAKKPRIYQLETTSKCNLACPMCPRTIDFGRSKNEDMSIRHFCGILDSMPWLKSLELFHFGEPFMQKDFWKYVHACTSRGIYSIIATNLVPASEKTMRQIFSAGLDFAVLDLDSLNEKEYLKVRVNGKFDRLKKNLAYFLEHPDRPYTVIQTINFGKQAYTEEELHEWLEKECGTKARPDEFRVKFLDSFRGSVFDKGSLDYICKEPFYGFSVHANGNVVPCDRDWKGENVMGNIFEESSEVIWKSQKYKEFRKRMKSKNKPDMCKNCPEGHLFNARSQQLVQVNMFKGGEV